MKDGLIISILSVIPKKPIARFMGVNARLELPTFLQKWIIRYFVWKYDVNFEECTGSLEDYNSLAQFFIRELKPGRRPIHDEPNTLASPVDGRVHAFGPIIDGSFEQYDDQVGSVAEMLGVPEDSPIAKRYEGGQFIIIYLSPQDYHRVHCHDEGIITDLSYFPGQLWPVFPAATRKIPHLFDRNERLVFRIKNPIHDDVESSIALIGAFGVGRMTTDWDPVITNNSEPAKSVELNKEVQKGAELGRFELGSTVVLFFEPEQIEEWTIERGQKVQLGSLMAKMTDSI